MRKIRFISLLLALILTASMTACGSGAGASSDTTASSGTTAAVTEDPRIVRDGLPEKDFGGETFTLLAREEFGYEFDAEQTGDVVDDAVYKRNQQISERFNVNMEYVLQPGIWAHKDTFRATITSAVMAGDDTYDIVTGQSNIILPLAVQGIFTDMNDAEHIDFDKVYWKEGFHKNARINDHLYALCGDYALSTLTASNVIFFNTKLFDEYQLDYPYEAVREGKWTLDKFLETASTFSRDLNGDGQMGDYDLYGWITDTNGVNPLQYSTECSLTAPDKDGVHVIDFPSEKEIDVFDKVLNFALTPSFRDVKVMTQGYAMKEAFMGGTAAMVSGTLKVVEDLRDMQTDFGIIPFPKYDEAQKEYVTSILRTVTVASVPTTCLRAEDCGFLLEAYAAAGYNDIIPAYYEVALKGKYSRDNDTAEMLDIVSSTSFFAFADVFYQELGANSDMLGNYMRGGTQGLASFFEGRKSGIEQMLLDLYEAYAE